MILSRALGIAFIKGRKVAGTSVEMALSQLCGPDDIVTGITPRDEKNRILLGGAARNFARDPAVERDYLRTVAETDGHMLAALRLPKGAYYNHMALRQVAALQDLTDLLVFGIERNPYSKIISLANMALTFEAYRHGGDMVADKKALAARIAADVESRTVLEVHNLELYLDESGNLPTWLMRYEALNDDWNALGQRIGKTLPVLPHAKRGVMSNTIAPDQLICRKDIERINDMFADEFVAFHYDPL